jgi:hypothetical protein
MGDRDNPQCVQKRVSMVGRQGVEREGRISTERPKARATRERARAQDEGMTCREEERGGEERGEEREGDGDAAARRPACVVWTVVCVCGSQQEIFVRARVRYYGFTECSPGARPSWVGNVKGTPSMHTKYNNNMMNHAIIMYIH